MKRGWPSRMPPRTAASITSRRATAPPRAAATNWRWPAKKFTWWTTATRRSSLPEVPLLGVLPGTGGLTRVVDKRKVRRDLADVFSTLAEGIKGKRAVEWRLVDGLFPRSRFQEAVRERALALAAQETQPKGPGIVLEALDAGSDRGCGALPACRAEAESRRTGTTNPRDRRMHQRRRRGLSRPCAPSANSTTRCCGCASTTMRSAW